MPSVNPIVAIFDARCGDMPREQAIDALVRCAEALHAGNDCPLALGRPETTSAAAL